MSDPAPPRTLALVSAGEGLRVPEWLGPALDDVFGTRSVAGAPLPLRREWRAEDTGRYLSSALVDALVERALAQGGGGWTLALTAADLCAPGYPRVFGEATVGGCCAVVSVARLSPGADPERFRRRLLTLAVHEVGHMAGLEHCPDARCALSASARMEEVDRKGPDPCRACRARLARGGALGMLDPAETRH